MDKVVQYLAEEEKSQIEAANTDLYLVEERHWLSGNYLVFSDTAPVVRTMDIINQVANADLVAVQEQNLDIMQGIADLWTVVDAMKGTV